MPDNTFYLDDMFGAVGVESEKKVGFSPSQVSELHSTKLIKLGLVQSSVGLKGLSYELKLGFVPFHTSELYGTKTLKLGLIPSHTSVVYGTLLKKLGFRLSYALTNIFYLDDIFGALGAASEKKLGLIPTHISKLYSTKLIKLGFVKSMELGPLGLLWELKLGFVPSHISEIFGTQTSKLGLVPLHSSEIYGILLKKLGLIPTHSSVTYGELLKKLGFIPSHISTIESSCLLKIGFVPSHTSIVYGLLVKGLGFIPIHEAKVYEFIVELKFYDRDDNLVKIISSKTQNFPLISPGLEFEFLPGGDCGGFGFTSSEDLGLEYNFRCDIYLYETLWYSGFITDLPKTGTKQTYSYIGYGAFREAASRLIKKTYTGNEVSIIVEDILDSELVPYTHIKKA